jgi:hypothetical protein
LNQICNKYGFEIEFINRKDILKNVTEYYMNDELDNNLIQLIKNIIAKSGTMEFYEEKRMMLGTLLTIQF